MPKMTILGLLLAVSLAGISGCGASDQQTTERRYSEDGYMKFSTSNPGILTSPGSRTYTRDTDLVNMALKDVPHIRKAMVYYRGARAIIRVRVDGNLSPNDVEAVRIDAERRISYMLPRYEVTVRAYQ